jgi:pimeloyl-ACP methyl ester carboxylesterase
VAIGARFYAAGTEAPTLLFFHGNGEIAADYEDLGPLYTQQGLNFLPVDYRGYGRSTGTPTVTAMMRDCQVILDFAQNWLKQQGFSGPLVVMGRSLGSASALELAFRHQDRLEGLIIESGFAYAGPLLKLLGVDVNALGFKEEAGFRHVDKIRQWTKPLLIIHAEFDHIIPWPRGRLCMRPAPHRKKPSSKWRAPTTTISWQSASPCIWRRWLVWVPWQNASKPNNRHPEPVKPKGHWGHQLLLPKIFSST